MLIEVEVDAELLDKVMEITGIKDPQKAVTFVLKKYIESVKGTVIP